MSWNCPQDKSRAVTLQLHVPGAYRLSAATADGAAQSSVTVKIQ